MMSLREVLAEAKAKKVALGHFNISELAALKAVVAVAKKLNVPVLIGLSEGEREFVGVRSAVALTRSLREELDHPIYLNADHTHSLEKLEVAVRAGFDEVIFDVSDKPFEENLKLTKQAVEMAKSLNPEIVVEGELGWIGSGSEVHERVPENLALTDPAEARQFVAETKIDVLAPAVGNMHGMLASMVAGETHKELNIERVRQLAEATGIFMTLHGGSGTSDESFRAAIEAGMTIVHVSTELRLAWRRGVEKALAADAKELTPYKLLGPAVVDVETVVTNRLKLFNNI
ncbi:MAG TPA: class II fructose-bisphosphate aldolase [Candidatus Paceibacterota bacterium]|nr:class II fructose-bisphosphate aldolase [Candidatus Paceibacterota bacterium]